MQNSINNLEKNNNGLETTKNSKFNNNDMTNNNFYNFSVISSTILFSISLFILFIFLILRGSQAIDFPLKSTPTLIFNGAFYFLNFLMCFSSIYIIVIFTIGWINLKLTKDNKVYFITFIIIFSSCSLCIVLGITSIFANFYLISWIANFSGLPAIIAIIYLIIKHNLLKKVQNAK